MQAANALPRGSGARAALIAADVQRSDSSTDPLDGIEAVEGKTCKGSDGVERAVAYIRLDAKLLEIHIPTHTFVISGFINLFWYDADFLSSNKDAPTGSLTDGDYAKTYELKDDGLNIPVNPASPFTSLESFEEITPPKLLYDPKTTLIFYTFSYRARLGARLGLQRFPFDRFQFRVRVQLRSGKYHLSPAPFAGVPAKWDLRNPVNIWLSQPVADEYMPRVGHACVWDCSKWKPAANLYLERHPDHYLTNAFLPLFLLVFIAALIHLIPTDELANRANVSIALLLTQFALKFALNSGIPVVPYRTFMDSYSLACTLMICLNLFVAATVSIAVDDFSWLDRQEYTQSYALPLCAVMGIGWTAANLVLLLNVRHIYRSWDELDGKQHITSMTLAKATEMREMSESVVHAEFPGMTA